MRLMIQFGALSVERYGFSVVTASDQATVTLAGAPDVGLLPAVDSDVEPEHATRPPDRTARRVAAEATRNVARERFMSVPPSWMAGGEPGRERAGWLSPADWR